MPTFKNSSASELFGEVILNLNGEYMQESIPVLLVTV